jgi:predicted permease
MQDLRLALRALRATPVVSAVAVLSLALGIGANTAMFSLVNGLLLRTLPVEQPDRLVTISTDEAHALGFSAGLGWNYAMWDALRERAGAFDGASAWKTERLDLAERGERQPATTLVTSGEFFTTLRVRPAIGRVLTPADDVRGGGPDGPAVVLSHAFWRRQFNGSTAVIGTTLPIERVPFRIIGVTPREFTGLEIGQSFDIAITLGAEPMVRGNRASIDAPRSLFLFVMLRLKPDQSMAAATAALRTMQPEMHGGLEIPRFVKEPIRLEPAAAGVTMPGSARPRYQQPLLTIFAIVSLVLLIACANIANLLLARAAARRHDVSVRLALGAPRWRLARQMLTESLLLAGLGAAGALVIALWGSRALVTQLSVEMDTSLDWRVLAFTAAITMVTALLFGTAAATRSMRVSPIDALKAQSRGVIAGRGRSVSSTLVVAQVALSLLLVAGAGLFVRSFTRLAGVPLGFDRDRVLLARVDVARTTVDQAPRLAVYQRIVDAVSAAPGVARAAGSMSTPLESGLPTGVTVSGAPASAESERVVLTNRITPGWFETYGTPMHAGRDFDTRDAVTSQPVAIVNDAFVRKFFPARTALGETVSQRTIVGVVADQMVQGGRKLDGAVRTLRDAASPIMYVPLAQTAGQGPPGQSQITISVRSAGHASAAMRETAAALVKLDPNLGFSMRTLAEGLDATLAQERIVASLSGFFGMLAVLLAGLGLYGVTSYAVARQRGEIAVRLALGAAPAGVVRLILQRVAVLVGIGIAAGAVAALWAGTFVASLLYGLTPSDPITILGAALALAAVGALAGGLPAVRASRIDPVTALREH